MNARARCVFATLLSGLTLALVLLGVTGCQAYRAGHASDGTQPPLRVHIAPIEVLSSDSPQVIAPLARQLRNALSAAPSLQLTANAADADATLRIAVVGVDRTGLARTPQDTGRPLSYLDALNVRVTWDSPLPAPWGTPNPRTFTAVANLYAEPTLIGAQTQTLPALTADIAAQISTALVATWPDATP